MADTGTSSTFDRGTLFGEILRILQPEGVDPQSITYYSEGEAQPGEWANIIEQAFKRLPPGSAERKQFIDTLDQAGFFMPTDDLNYWYNTDETDVGNISDLANAAEQRLPTILTDAASTKVGPVNVDESPNKVGVGGTLPDTFSILTSKDMRWYFDKSTGKWMVSYKMPNSNRHVFFEATGAQLDAIFGDGNRPTNFEEVTFQELAQREGVTFGGDIAEVEGKGSFEGEISAVVARALDEGVLPSWASQDPAIMDIIFIAQSEDKSEEWVIEQIAKEPSFKARFPGIDALTNTGLSVTEAVTGFLEFETGLKELELRDGGDPASVTPARVGDMLAKGHSLQDAQFVYGVFDRMEKNAGALAAFNEILAARGQQPLDEAGMYEFMAGNAPKELYDIWEETSLHRAAQDAGFGIGVQGAIDLARRTEGLTSYESAYEGLQDAAAKALQFRMEMDLGSYNINEQDLIDVSLGLAPSSGASQADLTRNLQRAFLSAKATRETARVNPFTGFQSDGTPAQQSLARKKQERA